MKYNIGIDLGGTKIAVGLVMESQSETAGCTGGVLVRKASVPTGIGRPAMDIAKDMAVLAYGLMKEEGIGLESVGSIGLGVPGTANRETGCIEYANNLGFYDVPFVELLKSHFPGKPVYFDNDANAAAWGEYTSGAGRGSRSMVAVTLGTGIGGGMILNGQLFEGVNFAAGELGHMVIELGGKECNCGRTGCFEAYASATALVEQTREAMEANPDSLLWTLCGGDINTAEGKTLFEGVRQGDETAVMVLDRFVHYLGCGILNIVNILQPEVLCIGGGISQAGSAFLPNLQMMMDREDYARTSGRRTKLVLAELGNDAGIIGAALLRD